MVTSSLTLLALSSVAYALPTLSELNTRQSSSLPQYVFDHAPLCWLDVNEAYFPSSLTTHLNNIHPDVNYTAITNAPSPLTLANLDSLNADGNGGTDVFLTANEGIAVNPEPAWFYGIKPTSTLSAPGSVIIAAPKSSNTVDAFYFFFYSYNLGNDVFNDPGLELGDHVGDWEHVMIRFVDSQPSAMYFSQHSGGQAFSYPVVKFNTTSGATPRPLVYVAKGSHANYPTPGDHDHTIPGLSLPEGVGALIDHTSQGTLWDPLSQPLEYTYDVSSKTFAAANGSPAEWLSFVGQWGDKQLPASDPVQKELLGFYKYDDGPTGPIAKNLGRTDVCESDPCFVDPLPPIKL